MPLPEEVRRMLSGPSFVYLGTLLPDGSPHVTPMWCSLDGDRILMNTAKGRAKLRNLQRDPRVSVAVHDPENPYSWAQIQGRVVEMKEEGAVEHINELSRAYVGRDYPLPEGMERVILVIEPDSASFAIRGAPGRG